MVVISENLPFKVRGESAEDRGKATCQDRLARPNEHAAISAHRARFVYLRLSIGAPTQCQSGAAQHGELERIEPIHAPTISLGRGKLGSCAGLAFVTAPRR
jgi:hypothetical protein